MTTTVSVPWERHDNQGHTFSTGRWGRYACRIDAGKRGVWSWSITDTQGGNRAVRRGWAGDRPGADAAVHDALDELPR